MVLLTEEGQPYPIYKPQLDYAVLVHAVLRGNYCHGKGMI